MHGSSTDLPFLRKCAPSDLVWLDTELGSGSSYPE